MKYFLLLLILCQFNLLPQTEILYEISFDNALHHEAEVKVKYSRLQSDTLKLIMSQTSPGRYAVHDFAKNIYNLKAGDGSGKELKIIHRYPNQWDITGYKGTAVVTYTLFADHSDGTYSGINPAHAHLNMPSAFIWAKGLEKIPITIRFNLPDKWKAATQLFPTIDWNVYKAPDMQYFMDSPVELSEFDERSWQEKSNGKNYNIKLAIHQQGSTETADAFTELIKAVVTEEKTLFGELPDFDNKEYIFIADFLPFVFKDGMEHRNSSVISRSNDLNVRIVKTMETISHEFFQCWNMERIRPKSLVPFDFERPVVCNELWFGEGFSEYYEDLILCRVGIINLDQFAEEISESLDEVLNSPGKEYYGPSDMSGFAPYVDGSGYKDYSNFRNTFISYYSYGAAIALALDLTLRSKFPQVSLDMLMKRMWTKFGRKEIPYTNEDIKKTLGEITDDLDFADKFFDRYITGKEIPDFEDLLSNAGLAITRKNSGKAYLGNIKLRHTESGNVIDESVLKNSPLFKTGIDLGDVLLRIDNINITGEKSVDSALAEHNPGETVLIKFEKNGVPQFKEIVFSEDPEVLIVPFEKTEKLMNENIRSFRKLWLGSLDPGKLPMLSKYCSICGRKYPFTYQFCNIDGSELLLTQKK